MFPRGVLIYITDRCSLKCVHCGIANIENPRFMGCDCFDKILELLKEKKCYIVAISGGDPILHPKLFEYIKRIRESKMLPVLGISGVGINEKQIDLISDSGIGCVQVSLDGACEKINKIFRGAGVFGEVISNIEKLQKKGVRVNVAICICQENMDDLRNMLKLCLSLQVSQVKVQFWERTEKDTNLHELDETQKESIIEQCLGFSIEYNLKEWIAIDNNYNSDKYNYLKNDEHNSKCIFFPNGDVKTKDFGSPSIGNILMDYERIKRHYE